MVLHSWCYGCGGPPPCQLRWFPPPCVCTTAAPAGETEEPGTESASHQAAKVSVSAKTK